jgi:hypothetical protein
MSSLRYVTSSTSSQVSRRRGGERSSMANRIASAARANRLYPTGGREFLTLDRRQPRPWARVKQFRLLGVIEFWHAISEAAVRSLLSRMARCRFPGCSASQRRDKVSYAPFRCEARVDERKSSKNFKINPAEHLVIVFAPPKWWERYFFLFLFNNKGKEHDEHQYCGQRAPKACESLDPGKAAAAADAE